MRTATELDLRIGMRNALSRLHLSYSELAEQARCGHFTSENARVTWDAFGGLGDVV